MIGFRHFCFVAGLALAATLAPLPSVAVTYEIVHRFTDEPDHATKLIDGEYPEGGVIFDASGKMYGTTFGALASGEPGKKCPKSCGSAYSFDGTTQLFGIQFGAQTDGAFPTGEPVFSSDQKTIYGTTEYGPGQGCGGLGCGTVFVINTTTGTEGKPFGFCKADNCGDGAFPQGTLTVDASNNVYGATADGGAGFGNLCGSSTGGCGTLFEIINNVKSPTPLYSFCILANCADGAVPNGNLVVDSSGNIYGTTQFGGAHAEGEIYKLAPNGTLTVLYSFCPTIQSGICTDGAVPLAGVIVDKNKNLFGTTKFGGEASCGTSIGCGVVFELSAAGKYSVLHIFGDRSGGSDGYFPGAPVTLDPSGNLFGTALKGGKGDNKGSCSAGCGVVFELPVAGGYKNYTVLHDFQEKVSKKLPDGAKPQGSLTYNTDDGFLYGATREGGTSSCDCGVIYKVKP